MATYYWRGGAGTWDATTTTNWATSSGGLGGAGPPTSADNVIFDSLSNATAYAVTVGTNAVAQDITIAGPAVGNVTITFGATAVLNCYGSWSNAATGVAFSSTNGSNLNFVATSTGKTINCNNIAFGQIAVHMNGVGGGWTLSTGINITQTLYIDNGSFNSGNQTVSAQFFTSSNSNVRSITLGSSAISLSGASNTTWLLGGSNLTFDAGTSTITLSNTGWTFTGNGFTYYNVNLTRTTSNSSGTILGANTFNNLNISSITAAGAKTIILGANQTINGTLTLGAANSQTLRMYVQSDTLGTPRTLTVATIATLSDVDFRDITAAGASGTWSGTRLGNGLGNTNITFAAGKTVYWNLVAGGNWSANAWATSTDGGVTLSAPATVNFPLAQDTAVINNLGLTTGNTITIDASWWLGTLNVTRTNAWTFAGTSGLAFYGNFTIPSVTTVTGTAALSFLGQGTTQTLTTNGVSMTMGFTVTSVGGTLVLNGAVTCASTQTVTLNNGTLNLSSYTLTTGLFSSSNSNARTIAFGTGKIVITGLSTNIWNTDTATNLTLTGTSRVELSGAGTAISFTASCSGTALTTTGSPALAVGNVIISATGASLGSITSGSGNSWVVGIGGTYASQTMVGAQQRIINSGFTNGTEANSPNFYVTAGVDAVSIVNSRKYGTVDFTGFAGYVNSDNWVFTIYGNLVLNSSIIGFTTNATFSGPFFFGATSGTKTITTAGKTYPVSITFNGVGGTWQLQDALTTTGALTMTNGTLQLAAGTTNTVGSFATSGTTLKYLQSTAPGSQATISDASGTNTATYLVITDSAATGGATWNATSTTNINAGNNTGWTFAAPAAVPINGFFAFF